LGTVIPYPAVIKVRLGMAKPQTAWCLSPNLILLVQRVALIMQKHRPSNCNILAGCA